MSEWSWTCISPGSCLNKHLLNLLQRSQSPGVGKAKMVEVTHIETPGNLVLMRSGWQIAICSNYFMKNVLHDSNWLNHSYEAQILKPNLTSGARWLWEESVPAVIMSRQRAHAENATHDEELLQLLRSTVQGLQAAHGYWITELILIYILWIEHVRKQNGNKGKWQYPCSSPRFLPNDHPQSP